MTLSPPLFTFLGDSSSSTLVSQTVNFLFSCFLAGIYPVTEPLILMGTSHFYFYMRFSTLSLSFLKKMFWNFIMVSNSITASVVL